MAADLRVVVKDPKGALVPDAAVTLRVGADSPAAAAAVTGATGVVVLTDVAEGPYRLQVSKDGFELFAKDVVVGPKTAEITVELTLAAVETAVEVTGKVSAMANSDPNYRALRDGRMAVAYRVHSLKFARDIGEFTFTEGEVCFAAPVLGKYAVAAFSGTGTFHMTPLVSVEQGYLKLLTGKIIQSGVSADFVMRVPVYADFIGMPQRLGSLIVRGNSSSPEFKLLLPKKPKKVMLNAWQDVLAHESVAKEM
jgi:hypothetical protein